MRSKSGTEASPSYIKVTKETERDSEYSHKLIQSQWLRRHLIRQVVVINYVNREVHSILQRKS